MLDLLEHILLSGLDISYFGLDLHEALSRARRGGMSLAQIQRGGRVGRALLRNTDWDTPPSGYFDTLGIALPIGRCLDNKEAMRERLTRMIDLAGRKGAVQGLVQKLNAIITPARSHRMLNLDRLSADLVAMHREARLPVRSLVSGRMVTADAGRKTAIEKDARWVRARRDMTIVWVLFDLQILAYRLRCAEHSALESKGSPRKVAGVGEQVFLMWDMANLAKEEHAAGKSHDTVDPALVDFCQEHRLEEIAQKSMDNLRLNGQLGESERHADIQLYLAQLREIVLRIYNYFKSMQSKGTRLSSAAMDARARLGKSATKPKIRKNRKGMHGVLAWDRDIATARFGAPSMVILCVGLLYANEVLGKLTHGGKTDASTKKKEFLLAPPHKIRRIEHLLFVYYRLFIIQDRRAFTGKDAIDMSKVDCDRLQAPLDNDGRCSAGEVLENAGAGDSCQRIQAKTMDDARNIARAVGQPPVGQDDSAIPWIDEQLRDLRRA